MLEGCSQPAIDMQRHLGSGRMQLAHDLQEALLLGVGIRRR
jgi:hypothetical protein